MNGDILCNKIGNQNRKFSPQNDLNIAENSTNDSKIQLFKVTKYRKITKKTIVKKGNYFLITKQRIFLKRKENTIRHSKLACDNITRKIKSWVIDYLRKIINRKIKEKEEKKGTKKKMIKYLYIINKNTAYKTKINDNLNILKKKVEEIFSEDISKKIKCVNIMNDYNKKIIEKIKKDKELNAILQLEFLDCIKNFMGEKEIECLKGFENEGYFSKKKALENNEYKKKFESFVNNIEKYYTDKGFRIKMNGLKE